MLYFSAWKNQKIDQVNIANKFKGEQMQFLKIQQVCIFGMVDARDAKSKA